MGNAAAEARVAVRDDFVALSQQNFLGSDTVLGDSLTTQINRLGWPVKSRRPRNDLPERNGPRSQRGNRELARLGIFLATCCLLSQSMTAAPTKEVRRVLILHSLGFSSPASIRVDEEIRAALDKSPYQIELYEETLQGILFSDPVAQKEARLWLIRKYRDRKPDVVIAVAPGPIRFMAESHNEFGPDTPIIICASSEDQVDNVKLDSRFTGAWRTLDAAKTLEAALRLRPDTKHVVVVGGGVFWYDKRLEAIVKEQLHSYESRFAFTYLSNLEMPALLEKLKRLPEHSIVFYTAISQDAAGTSFIDETQSLPMVVGAANAPVFVTEDTFIGQGTVGGYVTSYGEEGRVAGSLAVRILNGEKPQDIPIVDDTNVNMFDWRALQRWGLNEKRVPPGSMVLNRVPSAWDVYRNYILGAIFVVFAETLLVFALLWQRARRREVERSLVESEQRFRLVADTAPALIWMSGSDKKCTFFNEGWLKFTGRTIESELGDGWAEGVHAEDLQRCIETYTQAFDRREEFRLEYRLRRHNGEYRWLLDIGVPRLNDQGSFVGYIGSCVDLTDRKLAETALAGVSRRMIEAQEQERTRIARELHDDVGQRLALFSINLAQLHNGRANAPEIHSRIAELKNQISDIATDIQALSHRLHSSKLEYLGLATAMRGFCEEFGEQQKVEIDFEAHDLPSPLSPDISLCLFRVLQEALHNSAKYSGVKHFEVRSWGTQNEVHLTVSDSGSGFDIDAAKAGRGLGLISMDERLKILKGTLSIKSQLKRGTTVHAYVPLDPGSDTSA
jgi:PAS domain S-box-containing protein